MKTTKVNILVGRFQPFTLGHLKCATNALKVKGLPTVLCVIDTTKEDERHPFRTKVLWPAFKKMVKNYAEIQDIILVKNADLVKIGEALGLKGYVVKSWTCGTDRFAAYDKMCKKYAPDVECVEIQRDDKDISATEVRQAIKAGNEERFNELVPPEIQKLYPQLKEILDAM